MPLQEALPLAGNIDSYGFALDRSTGLSIQAFVPD